MKQFAIDTSFRANPHVSGQCPSKDPLKQGESGVDYWRGRTTSFAAPLPDLINTRFSGVARTPEDSFNRFSRFCAPAAPVARKTARAHGTPIYISRDGKVVAEKP